VLRLQGSGLCDLKPDRCVNLNLTEDQESHPHQIVVQFICLIQLPCNQSMPILLMRLSLGRVSWVLPNLVLLCT
jgi:hypothetical protein